MSIMILDNDDFDRAKKLAQSLSGGPVQVLVYHNDRYYNCQGELLEGNSQKVVFTFYHQRNVGALREAGGSKEKAASYSGGGGAEIPRPISGAKGFTNEESTHIVQEVQDEACISLKQRILGFWRRKPEILALCMLCEAWLAAKGEREVVQGRISVLAPTDLASWLKPFGQDADINALVKVIGGAEEMRAHTMAVLSSAAEGTLRWPDSRAAVEGLRNVLRNNGVRG